MHSFKPLLVVGERSISQTFPDQVVAFPLTDRDVESAWMAFDNNGQVAFQSAAEQLRAMQSMRNAGLDDVADDIETGWRLSKRSIRRIAEYARQEPVRQWCDLLRRRHPIIIDNGITGIFLGIEGTIRIFDRRIWRTIGATSPFSSVFRHRIDLMRGAAMTFGMILDGGASSRASFDPVAIDIAYRTIISRSWANLDWLRT